MSVLVRIAGTLAVLVSLLAMNQPASAVSSKTGASRGFAEVASCISGADNLLVSLVVDESASLRQTDPSALRVQGITTAVDSLEQLASTVDASTHVEVSMSTFARSYSTLVGWRALTSDTAQSMRATAERVLPSRDAGNATDYRQALLGAKQQLDARQREIQDPRACKLLLWFTDGALDVDDQTGAAATELCQVGGIADAVREDGIAVVALALFRPGGGVTQAQRDQLRAVAEGTGGGSSCGKTPIASDSSTGVYLPADDPASLQRLFAGAGALVAGGTELAEVSCPGPRCKGGAYRLDVDPGVAGARVLVQAADTPNVMITTPSGRRLNITNGATEQADGASISYLVRDRLATVNIAFDPYTTSRSRWTLRPSGRSELGVYWFWGAKLEAETSEIRAGSQTELAFRLQDQNGDPLDPSQYRGAQATIRVGTQNISARLTADGLIKGTFHQSVEDVPSKLPVSASLSVRTVPGGVMLGPTTVSERLPVTLPPAYPTVSPDELDFGHLEGVGKTVSTLGLTGSRMGATEVCVIGSEVFVPGMAPAPDLVRASSDCTKLEADGTGSVELTLDSRKSADGIATGKVLLRMTAADGSEDIELKVPLRLEMARQVDETTRWTLIVALLALALLIPAILLVGSNLLLARFILTSTSRTASKSVRITPTGLQALDGGQLLEPEDFENAGFSGSRRGGRLPLDGTGIVLKARRIFSLQEPQGVAVGPSDQLLVSSFMPYRGSLMNESPTGLGVVDASFVMVSPAAATSTEAQGVLVMVIPDGVNRQGIRDRASRISSMPDWRAVLSELTVQHERAVTTERDRPSLRASDDDIPDSPVEEAPRMPWDDASDGSHDRSPRETPRKSRFGVTSKPKKTSIAEPPPLSGTEDDTLPPLPDFLK